MSLNDNLYPTIRRNQSNNNISCDFGEAHVTRGLLIDPSRGTTGFFLFSFFFFFFWDLKTLEERTTALS